MIAISLVLAASIALVGHKQHSERFLWAGGLSCQAVAYALFALRGQIPDWSSIVLGNVFLATSFALYTTGIQRFRRIRIPLWVTWGPVVVVGVVFWLLMGHIGPRLVVGALLILLQSGIIIAAVGHKRPTPVLRGEWLIILGAGVMSALMVLRIWATLSGQLRIQFVTDGGWVQGLTFLLAVASTILLAIGLIIMSEERAEAALQLGERFQAYRSRILERMSAGTPLPELLAGITSGLEFLRHGMKCRIVLHGQPPASSPDGPLTGLHPSWSQPIVSANGKVLGTFVLHQENPEPPSTDEIALIRESAVLAGLALDQDEAAKQKQEAEALIHNQAFHDGLTQLPNRRLLMNNLNLALAAQRRNGAAAALMFMDLDNFKPLNDTHGHAVGDLLLVEVASRLSRQVREIDTVARFGGDEFVVLLTGLHHELDLAREQARKVAEKLLDVLRQPYQLVVADREPGQTVIVPHHCTASIGVVVFGGGTTKAETLIKAADAAMYASKQAGRNTVQIVVPDATPA